MLSSAKIPVEYIGVGHNILTDLLRMRQRAQFSHGRALEIPMRYGVGRIGTEPDIGHEIHVRGGGEPAVMPDAGRPLVIPGIDLAAAHPIEEI